MFSLEEFVSKTLKLLEKERETEIEETRILTEKLPAKELQRRGVCLLKLKISSRRSGLYGRTVITFEPNHGDLPSHNLTPGDIVGLNPSTGDSQSESLGSGIVTRSSTSAVSVAFDDSQDLFSLNDDGLYKLTKLANDVTYKRLKRALGDLVKLHSGPASYLVDVLFGQQELSPSGKEIVIDFVNSSLDQSQKEAVRFALQQREVAIVHGPPGTGKTTTVIEIILQSVKQGLKVLACAPSNIAVDNLVERLADHKQRIVRIGHPARVLPHIQKYSLDALLSSSEDTRLVEDVRKELDSSLSSLKKTRDRGEKQRLREDMKHLRKELMQREQTATRDILKRANVVLVTLTSATEDGPMKLLNEEHFDLVVIDECSQALEAACWIALLRAPKCVLAGDHLQLPPTILSKEAAKDGLEVTLMERVLKLYCDRVMKMLTCQYRMNELIMQWSSDQLYQGKLVADESVRHHLLRDLPSVTECEETSIPLMFIDTAGCELRELDLPEEISKGNEGEADIVAAYVEKLISCGLSPEDIAVIAPYNLQVELIRLRLSQQYPKLEVKSVDGFQGREKEAVVISFVRSNPKGEVGFLAENRRINVAITRARRHLCVIGDSETVSHDKFLKTLVEYLTTKGEVQTAHQYIDVVSVNQGTVPLPEHLSDLMSLRKTTTEKGAKPKTNYQEKRLRKQNDGKEKHIASSFHETATNSGQTRKDGDNFEDDEKVQEYQILLETFINNNGQEVIEFSPSLSSHERYIIHVLSEKLGLLHCSKGVDEERHIVVRKPGTRENDSETRGSYQTTRTAVKSNHADPLKLEKNKTPQIDKSIKNDVQSIRDQNQSVTGDSSEPVLPVKKSDKVACAYCGKDVIKANFQLHELHCARKEKQDQHSQNAGTLKSQEQSKARKEKSKIPNVVEKLEKIDNDDFEALIATVQTFDGSCCFRKCKTPTATLGYTCEFCQGRFCLSHHIPEVHGCGDAAKAAARAVINKEGVLSRGSAKNRHSDAEKKIKLQKKLDNKLSKMAEKRKGKQK
ncbi:hypothetical protein CHS0354_023602 [Potamilus streckersoni]|uniref:DNA helicase n=1 Tax=Potamilus streckersoni TaxID=2493646 RepID=A0AAE0SM74_9BIVA|nr:hypothetical protein CHS0354_023602 [Potamilus streckersoni]